MKWIAACGLLLVSMACSTTNNTCCANTDCPGSNICSADCRGNQALQGTCLYPCMVDRDCSPVGQVCNIHFERCGCEAADAGSLIGDAGEFVGTCSGNVGH